VKNEDGDDDGDDDLKHVYTKRIRFQTYSTNNVSFRLLSGPVVVCRNAALVL